jgi:hypothetical protein
MKRWLKWLFPYELPLTEKTFDSWYQTLNTASRNLYFAAFPYFWISKEPFWIRLGDTVLMLVFAYLLQFAAYKFDKKKSYLTHPSSSEDRKDS